MSDPNTPPPMDDSNDENAQPPSDQTPPAGDAPPPSQAAAESTSTAGSVPTEPPSTAGVGLGLGKLPENEEKTMSLLAHILGGVTCILGPLIIWLIKKDDSPFVDDQGKEALNFQITVLIGYVISAIIAMIPVVQCITILLYPAIGIASLIFAILGGIEANKGTAYRYPFALRLVS